MVRSGTPELVSTPDSVAVQEFLATTRPVGCARLDGAFPSEPSIRHLAAVHDSTIVGYARASAVDDRCIVDCRADDPDVREQLVTTVLAGLPTETEVTWWGHESASDSALAAALHMAPPPHRRLLNMSRALPLESALVDAAAAVMVRPFVVGRDERAWLQVNNAAFLWHTEQRNWKLASLQSRFSEPWFDPKGFLLHERDGRLAAFCWTKVHDSGIGEIYVIAVHPDFHGLGLGRALTIAGLRHLASIGSTKAMLYVEADNTAAVRLYESLGFQITHTDVAYQRPSAPGDAQ